MYTGSGIFLQLRSILQKSPSFFQSDYFSQPPDPKFGVADHSSRDDNTFVYEPSDYRTVYSLATHPEQDYPSIVWHCVLATFLLHCLQYTGDKWWQHEAEKQHVITQVGWTTL